MSCMPTSARLIELKNRLDRLKREVESTVSNIRCFVTRGNSVVAFQESIQDVERFLRTYPSAGAELDLLVNNIVKLNCELEIALARRSEISDAVSGYENNDSVLFDGDSCDKQTLSCCSACSKENKTAGVCTEVQPVNTIREYCVDDISRLYDLEKESILEMRHLLGENPSEFWLGFFSDKELQSHLSEVKQRIHSGELHHLATSPKIRQFIIGYSDGVFRGSVLSVHNGNIVAVDIDTGMLRFGNVHDSWEIGDCLLRFPPQALLCKLSSITGDVEWCKFLCNMLRNCLSKCNLVVTVKNIIPGFVPIFVVDIDAHDNIILDFNINQWIYKYVNPAFEKVELHELSDDDQENLFKKIDPYVIYKEESTESNSEHFSESESHSEVEGDFSENDSNSLTVDENFSIVAAEMNLEESPFEDLDELVTNRTSENMKGILMNNKSINNCKNDEMLQESWNESKSNTSSTGYFKERIRSVRYTRTITEMESQQPGPIIKSASIKCSLEKGATFEMSFLKGNDPWNFILHYISKEEYDQLKKDMRQDVQNGSIKPLRNLPVIGDFAIGKCDLEYCRVCVTDVSPNSGKEIVAIDIDDGGIKLLSLSDLWEIDDSYSLLPAMIVNCSLWNITRNPFYWNHDLEKLFIKVLSIGPVKVHVQNVEPVLGNWKHVVQIETMHDHVFDVSEWIMLHIFPNVREIQQLSISGKNISGIISKIDPYELYNERLNIYATSPQCLNDSETAMREVGNKEYSPEHDIPSISKLQNVSDVSVLNNDRIVKKNKSCFEHAYENYKNKEKYSMLCNNFHKNNFIESKEHYLDVTAGTKYYAFLSSILSPSEFYVHVVTVENSLIDEMHKELQSYCSVGNINFQSKKEAEQLIVNCCAVHYDNQWCRGRVIDWLDECIDDVFVFIIDYGIYTSLSFHLVQCLRSDFYIYPPFAQRCSLAYITPPDKESTWPTRSLEGFWKILDFEIVYEIYIESYSESDKTITVFLSYGEGKDIYCINDYLIDENLAVQNSNLIVSKPEYCHSIVCPIVDTAENLSDDEDSNDGQNKTSTLEIMPLFDNNTSGLPGVGDQLPIVITEIVNFGSFYGVLAENDYGGKYCRTNDILMDMNKKITSAAESRQLKPLKTLNAGSVVVARFTKDKVWYRARLLTHVDDNGYVEVFFVDYGNIDKVHKEYIKEIRKDFCIFPFQAMRFFIEGIGTSKLKSEIAQKKALQVLRQVSEKGIVEVKVVRIINEDVTVCIFSAGIDITPEILNQLHEQSNE